MRSKYATIAVVLSLVVALSGCTRGISGTAKGDLDPPRVEITQDSDGIRAGLEDAPVQLEIYTEPQCTHCADLQHAFGDQFAYYIGTGQLAITYRPMTFLDSPDTDVHSARVANALFVAATPGGEGDDAEPPPAGSSSASSNSCGPINSPAARGPTTQRSPTSPASPTFPASRCTKWRRVRT